MLSRGTLVTAGVAGGMILVLVGCGAGATSSPQASPRADAQSASTGSPTGAATPTTGAGSAVASLDLASPLASSPSASATVSAPDPAALVTAAMATSIVEDGPLTAAPEFTVSGMRIVHYEGLNESVTVLAEQVPRSAGASELAAALAMIGPDRGPHPVTGIGDVASEAGSDPAAIAFVKDGTLIAIAAHRSGTDGSDLEPRVASVAREVAGELSRPLSSVVSNGLIAYSTDHAEPTDLGGSDIYVVREGSQPLLVAGREGGAVRNSCPAFSPDGSRLAFARRSSTASAIVVLDLDASGAITGSRSLSVPQGAPTDCPRWSADSERLGFLQGTRVTVLGLDGRTVSAGAGDPQPGDFSQHRESDPLVAPASGYIAREVATDSSCNIVISTKANSVVRQFPCLGFGMTWSPDGRRLLFLEDVGAAFAIRTYDVETPGYGVATIVLRVEVNSERSWPGRGDVSWQPVYR